MPSRSARRRRARARPRPARSGGRPRRRARVRLRRCTARRAATARPASASDPAPACARAARRAAARRGLRVRSVCAPWPAPARALPLIRSCARSAALAPAALAAASMPQSTDARPSRRRAPSARSPRRSRAAPRPARRPAARPAARRRAPARAQACARSASTPASSSAMRAGGSGSKRTCWQREAIVAHHVLAAVGQEQQVHERRRFLERLQHAVGRLVVHRVDGLDHEHPPRGLKRRARGRRHDRLLDVGHQHLRGARGRHPGQVRVRAPRDPLAPPRPGRARRRRAARRRTRARSRACRCPPGRGTGTRARDPPCGGSAGASTARACGCASMPGSAAVGSTARHLSRHGAIVERYRPGVPRGRLITIEGLDGAGKSTLAEALAREISARGHAVELLARARRRARSPSASARSSRTRR